MGFPPVGSSGVGSRFPLQCTRRSPPRQPRKRWCAADGGGSGGSAPQSAGMSSNTATTPLTPEQLLEIYDVPHASAAEFLCDRHDPDAVAFTIIDADLSGRDITYGELRLEREKVAAAPAALAVAEGGRVAHLMSNS